MKVSMALPISALDDTAVELAQKLIKSGEVIALPTDTIYGFACSAIDVNAIDRLYGIKRRNENKPVAVCVGQVGDIQKWAYISHLPECLLSALLPGPVTLVLKCVNKLDKSVVHHNKVGIRIPDHNFIRAIANGLNCPLALTSANISSEPSPLCVTDFEPLWSKVAAVFDGGSLGVADYNRQGSTVVDLSITGFYKIIRPGVAYSETVLILQKFGLKLYHE